MRCPDCNKFVAYGDGEVELQDLNITGATVTGTIHVSLPCGECGTELKSGDVEFEQEVTELQACADARHELEADEESTEFDTKSEGSGRYMKMFYGGMAKIKVTCLKCEKSHDVEVTDHIQASSMEEAV